MPSACATARATHPPVHGFQEQPPPAECGSARDRALGRDRHPGPRSASRRPGGRDLAATGSHRQSAGILRDPARRHRRLHDRASSASSAGGADARSRPIRDELLDGKTFYTIKEAQVLIEARHRHYNAIRPYGRLGYRTPAPETIVTPGWPPGSATLRRTSSLAEKSSMP